MNCMSYPGEHSAPTMNSRVLLALGHLPFDLSFGSMFPWENMIVSKVASLELAG
jgi:hypothetical protein